MAKYAMLAMTRKRHPHPNPLPRRAREKYGESPEEDEGKRDRHGALSRSSR